jgi:galactonate dehydratase
MISVPLAIGEEFASKWAFLPFIEQRLTDFARVDICNVGGFTEAMKVAGMAEAYYIDLMPHNPLGPVCTAAAVHLGAAAPNFSWMEIRVSPTEDLHFYADDLFPKQLKPAGPVIAVPDGPGLRVELNEELAASQGFRFGEAPHWVRRDGSVTNW